MPDKDNRRPAIRTLIDWLKVAVLLLDEAAAVVLVVVVLRFLKIQVPLPVAIVLGLLFGTIVFIIHKAVIPSFHRKVVTGSEGMAGREGRVVQTLNPKGVITIGSERWKAKSVEDYIEVDEDVEIIELDGLTLKVKRKGD